MTKEEQIQTIAQAQGRLCKEQNRTCADCSQRERSCDAYTRAAVLYERGIRPEEAVRKEAIRQLFDELWSNAEFEPLFDNDDGGYIRLRDLKETVREFGVEVS